VVLIQKVRQGQVQARTFSEIESGENVGGEPPRTADKARDPIQVAMDRDTVDRRAQRQDAVLDLAKSFSGGIN